MKAGLFFVVAALSACAAHASHPLITEDTGVLGKGERQLELHGTRGRDAEEGARTRTTDASAVLGYGFAEAAEIQLELPYLRESVEGDVIKGRGDASLAVKWRFFEREGIRLVFKPQVFLPTGRDELGLGAGKSGWGANLVAGYEAGRWEFLLHGGYAHNRNVLGERRSLRHASAAVLFSATEKAKLVLDVSSDTNPDPSGSRSLREAVLGALLELSKDFDLGFGVKRGLNDAAEDRSALLGLKLRW